MSPPSPRLITDPPELSPEWMTTILRRRGLDVTVSSLRSEPVGTGQMAHNERIFLEYEGDATDAPGTLVGKFPSPSEESRAAGARGAYRLEALFYTALADKLPIRTPECLVERSADEVYAGYVYGSFQGPSITMLGALFVGQTDRGDEMFMAMAERAMARIRDLNALDLLA